VRSKENLLFSYYFLQSLTMKIFVATGALFVFILSLSVTAEYFSGTKLLKESTYSRTVSYAGQSVISCDAIGLPMAALDSLHRDHDVLNNTHGHIHVRVTSADERAEVEATVGSVCEYLYDLEDVVSSFEDELTTSRRLFAEDLAFDNFTTSSFERKLATSRQGNDWFATYHTFREIVLWYKDLNSDYPSITTFVNSVGKSREDRDIPAFHVTAPKKDGDSRRKVWIQCQVHAREWISAPSCMYIVHSLVTLYEKDKATTDLLKNAELIVIPIVNPDGYVHTWTQDRLWRKNRSPQRRGCYGTDLNRNYDDHWSSGIGTSEDPCKWNYKGTSAASEPEIASTTAYFLKNAPIYGAIDIHAYSQLILSPLGWSKTKSPDIDAHADLMAKMETAIKSIHGRDYTSKAAFDLYPSSGTALDWFYGEGLKTNNGGVRAYSVTFELLPRNTRDNKKYGFELPAEQIRPNGEELLPSIMIFMKTAIESPLWYGTPTPSNEFCVDKSGQFSVIAGYSTSCKEIHMLFDREKRQAICESIVTTGVMMTHRCPIACAHWKCYSYVGSCRDSDETFKTLNTVTTCKEVKFLKETNKLYRSICFSHAQPLINGVAVAKFDVLVQEKCPVACLNIKCTCADMDIPFVSEASFNSLTNEKVEDVRQRTCKSLYGIKNWEYRNVVCLLDIFAITPYFGNNSLKVLFDTCALKHADFRKNAFVGIVRNYFLYQKR